MKRREFLAATGALGLSLISPKGSDRSLVAFAVRYERAARIRIA